MTAIFAIWNNYGFSLAADSNQTATSGNQQWVDPVEKTLMLKNHQIAIGAAGDSTHNGVEINEIFRTWESTLQDNHFDALDDYFINFCNWFYGQSFGGRIENFDKLKTLVRSCFEKIYVTIQESSGNLDTENLETTVIASYKNRRNSFNFLGPNWDQYSSISDLTREPNLTERKIDALREKLIASNDELMSFNFLFDSKDELRQDVMDEILPIFSEIFSHEFDYDSQFDLAILNITVSLISNISVSYEEDLEAIMVGYGKNDWLPTGITFKLYSNLLGLRRLQVTDWSNPNVSWYMSIAIDAAVSQLTEGISRDRIPELLNLASAYIDSSQIIEFSDKVYEQSMEKFHKTLKKIDQLTLDRLEFLAKLFVQIEALKSFLDQPVPGVGGDIKLISMTKTTKREKYIQEFSN